MDPIAASPSRLARIVLTAFLFTFIAARILVLAIMLRWIPDLFLHLGGTHVHHLNYGIILLSITGAITLFWNLSNRHRSYAALAYGVGLGLTFDEFGMWLHLGGGYWQRASYDAIISIAGLLGLIALAPSIVRLRSRHWSILAGLLLGLIVMFYLARTVTQKAAERYGPDIKRIEADGPH